MIELYFAVLTSTLFNFSRAFDFDFVVKVSLNSSVNAASLALDKKRLSSIFRN